MFENRVVWITGSSSGIGEALALQFAEEKARLVLSARRQAELERVRGLCLEHGLAASEVLVLPLDILDQEAMPEAVARVVASFGTVDVLVNNAGISQRSVCIDTDMLVYRQLMEINVLGQIALTKQVLPLMYEQGSGLIAVTSSVAGKVGAPFRTGYCAAKHAVMGFFDALRAEVAQHGIRVATITPGFIRTDLSLSALTGHGHAYGKMDADLAGGMDVTRCAEVIMRGLRRGKPEIAVGKGMEMHALWLRRFFPRLLFRITEQIARKRESA
ncbi:MAG: SDR family oxidoreductase [Planctomycetes bacterium]|jgi:short-subunit dehydrogenase|nr:SDR family oxidoreductase [Planctomycetota bacterium]